jgi:hypothetical protein
MNEGKYFPFTRERSKYCTVDLHSITVVAVVNNSQTVSMQKCSVPSMRCERCIPVSCPPLARESPAALCSISARVITLHRIIKQDFQFVHSLVHSFVRSFVRSSVGNEQGDTTKKSHSTRTQTNTLPSVPPHPRIPHSLLTRPSLPFLLPRPFHWPSS